MKYFFIYFSFNKGEIYEGQHEAVVSKELYEEILRVNKLRSREKYDKHYLLSGKVVCGHCGAKYRYQKWGKRLVMYCNSQQSSRKRYVKDPNCKNKRWDTFEIEHIVLEQLFSMSLDENLFKETFNIATVNVINELKERLDKINKQISNLISFISEGIAVEETRKKIKELENERESINAKIENSEQRERANKVAFETVKSISSTWNCMTFEEQRSIIEHLIDHVEIDNNKISIFYKIY